MNSSEATRTRHIISPPLQPNLEILGMHKQHPAPRFTYPEYPASLAHTGRPHTVHSTRLAPILSEQEDITQTTQRTANTMQGLDVLAKAAASQRASLSRDDTAADVSQPPTMTNAQEQNRSNFTSFEEFYRSHGHKFHNAEDARTAFSQQYRRQHSRDGYRNMPHTVNSSRDHSMLHQTSLPSWTAGPWPTPSAAYSPNGVNSDPARRGSLLRRLSRGAQKFQEIGHNIGRRTNVPSHEQPQQAFVDPSMLTLSRPQPTSPVKRNGTHGDDRPRKFRPAGIASSTDRKDTPAPPFGQQSRVGPSVYTNLDGGHSARQAAARLNTAVPESSIEQDHADFFTPDDIHSQRPRYGSIPSAADSGADLTTFARFDTPERDCDGDIVMSNVDEEENKGIDFVANKLPNELRLHIFSLLDAKALCAAQEVSKRWSTLAKDESIWRVVFLRRYQRQVHTDPAPVQVGGVGIGQPNKPQQQWKRMYRARAELEKQWRMGADKSGKATYLSGHTDSVYCVQFDEEKIITGSRDRTIRVWDINTNQCIRVIGGPHVRPVPGPKPLRTVDYPSFHSAVASVNGTTYGNSIYTVPSQWHDASILCLQYDNKVLVTGSSDSDLIVWDINTYEPIRRLRAHTGGVLDVALDAKHIVSCSKDSRIIVWDRETYEVKGSLVGHRGPVNAVQLRGKFLVSASGDGIARLWNIETMRMVKEFSAKERGLAAVEFSEEMKHVLAGGNDHITYKFEVDSGNEVKQFTGHTQLVRSLWLDSANDRVVSGSYDLDLRVYDFQTGEQIWRAEEWTTSWMLAAKSDYRRIVATSQDGRVLVIDFGLRKDRQRDGCPIEGVDLLREIPIEQSTAIIFTNPWEPKY